MVGKIRIVMSGMALIKGKLNAELGLNRNLFDTS